MSSQPLCLVTGASGYIGGRLVPELLAAGYPVRCMARDPAKLSDRSWSGDIEVAKADVLDGIRHQLQVLRNRWRNIVGEDEYIARYLDCAVAGMVVEVQIIAEREQRAAYDAAVLGIKKAQAVRAALKDSFRNMEGMS